MDTQALIVVVDPVGLALAVDLGYRGICLPDESRALARLATGH
jgi:hypothetical protein